MTTDAVPNIQRVYLTLKEGTPGKVDLRLSLVAPETVDDTMAVLVLRGSLPAGFPQDIPLLIDTSPQG